MTTATSTAKRHRHSTGGVSSVAELNEVIRTNLRAIREERGYTPDELTERCDFDSSNVKKIERGHDAFDAESLIKLAVELETQVSDFFVKNGQPREHAQSLSRRSYDIGSLVNGSEESTNGSAPDLESLFNTSEALLLLLDENGNIFRASSEYEKICGEEPKTDGSTPFWKTPLWFGANERRIEHLLTEARESGQFITESLPVSTPKGSTRPMEISICPILTEEGDLRQFLIEGNRI